MNLMKSVPSIWAISIILLVLTAIVFADGLRYRIKSRRVYLNTMIECMKVERQMDILGGSIAFLQKHLFANDMPGYTKMTVEPQCPDSLKGNVGGE